MRIVNLIENTEGSRGCLKEHGLSFYVETAKHKILVDTGASDAFMKNAVSLAIDLKQVDTVILSHGHYDHGGGILDFAKLNPIAIIWMQKSAMGEYYHKNIEMEKYIGIDAEIMNLSQVRLIEGDKRIDEELFLFGGVTGRKLWPEGNKELKEKKSGSFFQDDFLHEQYLVLTQGNKKILFSGCAHNGILNILEKYREIYGSEPDAVISGFHMRRKFGYAPKELEMIEEIAKALKHTKARFYTGHCTGEIPYQIMKESMGDQIVYVHSGDEITIL